MAYLFFAKNMLTPEGVTQLQRLHELRLERDFGNLPHDDAYAVFHVYTNDHGTVVAIEDAASDNPQVRESYLLEGLTMALDRNGFVLDLTWDRARRREEQLRRHAEEWRRHAKGSQGGPETGP